MLIKLEFPGQIFETS